MAQIIGATTFIVDLGERVDVSKSLEVLRRPGDDLIDRWDGRILVRTAPVDGAYVSYAGRHVSEGPVGGRFIITVSNPRERRGVGHGGSESTYARTSPAPRHSIMPPGRTSRAGGASRPRISSLNRHASCCRADRSAPSSLRRVSSSIPRRRSERSRRGTDLGRDARA